MDSDYEELRICNYLLYDQGSNRFWPVDEIQLPLNQNPAACLHRVNQALLKRQVIAAAESIELYKPREPLSIDFAETNDWRATISDPQGKFKTIQRVMPRSFLASLSENALDDNTVHLVIFFAWKEAAFNYVLFHSDRPWAVRRIKLPVHLVPQECLDRVEKALLESRVTVNINSMEFYKPLEPLLVTTAKKSKWQKTIIDPSADLQPLLPANALYKSFTPEEVDNRTILHLVITTQALQSAGSPSKDEGETDTVAPLREFFGTRFRKFHRTYASGNAKTPSVAAKSSEFRKIQATQVPIYDGRRAPGITHNSSTITMPPSLYHPVFETWKKNAFDPTPEPPPAVVTSTAILMREATVLYEKEKERSQALRGPLQELLGRKIHSIVNTDGTEADGCIVIQLQRGQMTYILPELILEEKRKAAEGTDATTQAAFSMIRVWTDAKLDDLCNLTCCPTFLLGFSGCQFEISAAVLTDKCIVQRLATLWVGRSSNFDLNHIVGTARVFHALSMALDELEQWYRSDIIASRGFYNLDANKPFNHPRFFPHADQYPVNGEDFHDAIKFEYLYPLETSSLCATFVAKAVANPSDEFVVKFTQRYCPAVHYLLEDHGMAPALRYCGKIDEGTPYENWQMVVMDYYNGSPPTTEQAPKLREDVRKAVAIGHEAGFVFGDIRRPNVLVGKEDGQVKLIDFDWAGKEGVRYPPDMSDNHLLWVSGMEPMAVIEKQHDLGMIDKWFPA